MLEGKKIILAVTASIAAYKTPELVRSLVKKGAIVKVVMTTAAKDFVTPLSLSTVSNYPVLSDVNNQGNWNNHVELGLWADIMMIAPCSANTLAKLANGICDNILQAVYLSARCPIIVAPAMDADMWIHPATQSNVEKLKTFDQHFIIEPEHGFLASGLIGKGRLPSIDYLVGYLETKLESNSIIKSENQKFKSALVTAGPTYELIDPVRFIGNYSSGKMGIAIAEALATQGIAVTLVLGPSNESVTDSSIDVRRVTSGQEMYEVCMEVFPKVTLAIMTAAVADFKPKTVANQKIKKGSDEGMTIELVRNPDILATLGTLKTIEQTLVGFALETNNEIENAKSKLVKKNADFIILNSLQDKGAGFGGDTNKVTIISKNDAPKEMPLLSKKELSTYIVDFLINI